MNKENSDKNPKEIMFGKKVSEAVDDFNKKIEDIKERYHEFLKENEINFDNEFVFQYSPYSASYNITNQKIINVMGEDIKKAYNLSFSELLK